MPKLTIEDEGQFADSEVGQALIDHCKLSHEAVQKVMALGRLERLNFVEAALRLGVVTGTDVEDAIAWSRRRSSPGSPKENPSLIESVISKIAVRRFAPETADTEPVVPSERLVPAHDADHSRSEQLRALCTDLLLSTGAASGSLQNRAIALLSPFAGEGRSQLAAEMAIGFSQLGRETLLIDADLRKPMQHVLFNADNQAGLTQMLGGTESLKVQRVKGQASLRLLTSGPLPDNPLELLSDGRLARLVALLRGTYEFIILDSPPVDLYADGLAIATTAKEAMVVSRANQTTYKSIRELLRRFATTRAQMVGAVVNYF